MAYEDLLIHRCDVLERADGKDAMGGFVNTFETVRTDIPCRYRPLKTREKLLLGMLAQRCDCRVYFGQAVAVTENTRFKVYVGSEVKLLSTQGVRDVHGMGLQWYADCEEQTS